MLQTVHDLPSSEQSASYARRRRRFRALEWLRPRTPRKSGRRCLYALGAEATVGATADGITHIGGVTRCGSSWACPVCAPTIGERRAVEIDQAITAWTAAGGSVLFVTATLSHQWHDDLGNLLGMLQGAWSRTWNWQAGARPEWYGGQIRTVEVTHGSNGWHPHVHAAVFIEAGWDDCMDDVRQEVEDMGYDWQVSVERYAGKTLTGGQRSPGWDVRQVNVDQGGVVASYMAKIEGGWGAGLELARVDLKAGRRGGLSPQELLSAAVDGDMSAARLYRLYELATAGRQRIVASPGLMARCEVEEQTDDEAAAGEAGELVAVASVPATAWRKLLRAGFLGQLCEDVAAVARGEPWGWPAEWLVIQPAIQR